MGSGPSKYDDKDDNEFLALDGLSLYNDEYICAIEEKISAGEPLTSFEEELLKLKKDIVDTTKQSFDSYNGSLESLATVFSSRFDRLVKVEDFDSLANMQEKLSAFDFMRGRRYLLLDRILQAQTNMISHQRSMNDSDSASGTKKKSVYWNLPTSQSGAEPRDDTKIASMLSLTMTLSLAKTLGTQNSAMLAAILQNLLQSWASFEALCFAKSSTLTLTTIKQFEDFAMDIIGTKYEDNTSGTELKSLAVSFLFAIGVLRGSVELISESAYYLVHLNLKLDTRVNGLIKQLGNIEPKYAMHFPQKCGPAEKIPIASIDSNTSNATEEGKEEKGVADRVICANGSHVFMFAEDTNSIHKISIGGRGSVPGDVLNSCKDVDKDIKNELAQLGVEKPKQKKKRATKDKSKKATALRTENLPSAITVSELTVRHNHSNPEHWNCVLADQSMPVQTAFSEDTSGFLGRGYFEVTIKECATDQASSEGVIGIGFADPQSINCENEGCLGGLGAAASSFGLMNYAFGLLQGVGVVATEEFPTFVVGDVVGCGIDYNSSSIFYTKNGRRVAVAFNLLDLECSATQLAAAVCFQGGTPAEVEVNFGDRPFQYSGEEVVGPFGVVHKDHGEDDDDKSDDDSDSDSSDISSSLAFINGKLYLHHKKFLQAHQFAVFDANSLNFLGIESFSLVPQATTLVTETFTINLATERFVDIQVQKGLVLEIVSAKVGDHDIRAVLEEHLLFDKTWVLVSSKVLLEKLKSTLTTDTLLTVTVGWRQLPDKVEMALPVTSYQHYLIGVQHVKGDQKVFSSYERLKFVNAKFTSASADDDLIAIVTTCWENYLEAVAESKELVLPELFVADWEFLRKYAKEVEDGQEVGLDLEFVTVVDDEDPYDCSYTKEEGITWNDILECICNEAEREGQKHRVVFLDTRDHQVKHSFDLDLSDAPDFLTSELDTMELYFNGIQLQINFNMLEEDTISKLSSWKFSFKQNGKFQTFEAAEFNAETLTYNFASNCFDLSTNTFSALTPDGKYLLRWKNLGASPAVANGDDLLKEAGAFDETLFQSFNATVQSKTIMEMLDRISGPYQVADSGATQGNAARLLKAEIRSTEKKPEVNVSVAGKPITFPVGHEETTGVFVVVFDETYEAEKTKFFSLEDEGALSTTRFVEFVEALPLGKCVVVVVSDMQDDDLRRGAYESLKSLGLSDLTHSHGHFLIAIGRKGLTPGLADSVSEESSGCSRQSTVLSRLLPPLHIPMCMEPTARTLTNLLSICEACHKEYEATHSEDVVSFLTPVLNLLALNLKNITMGLPVKAYWKLLGEDVIKRLEKTLNILMTSDLKARPSLQATITSMFCASMDLLYSSAHQKMEALRAYSDNSNASSSSSSSSSASASAVTTESATTSSSAGDSDILTILLTDVSLPKNYLTNKSRIGVDRNHTTAVFNVCETLFRTELRRAVDRYLSGPSYLQESLSKLYGVVVTVLSSISTNLLAIDLQTVEITQGKLTLTSPTSMALFLEVFTIMARLSAELLNTVMTAFTTRSSRLPVEDAKGLDALRKDFFAFLETSPVASILPTIINAFTRLVKAGGYQFTNKIIDEALGLMKELDRCVTAMGQVFGLVPSEQAKISDTVPTKPIKKRTIESEHPYRSNMNETTPVSFPGASKVVITFDPATRSETNCDYLIFQDKDGKCLHLDRAERFTGRDGGQNWPGTDGRPPLELAVSEFNIFFHSDGSVEDWGYKMFITAYFPPKTAQRNRLEWIAKMNVDLVEIQSALAVTLVQGPAWKPLEDEYSSWMENPLVRPEYFSFNPDLDDEVDRFLHALAETPVPETPVAKFLHLMRRRVPVDQGSVEAINRAVYATCAAIIRANNLSAEAFALATGKRDKPSDAMIKAWTTGQKMREYFKLSDVKSSMESTTNTAQRKAKFSLYEGAPDEVVEEASKEIIARAQFLLRIPKEKGLDDALVKSNDDLDASQIDVDLDVSDLPSPMRSAGSADATTPTSSTGGRWRMAARGVQMMRQVSEETRKANEIWHSLVDGVVAKDHLKNIFQHRRTFAEKNKAANALTTTEKVLHFVQSDVDIDRLHEVNHLRNKRAISRTKGFDMFYRLLSGLSAFPSVVAVVLERLTQTMHRMKRDEGTAGSMIHYSTALEGCSGEQNNLLWQKFSAIYKKCVEIVTETKIDAGAKPGANEAAERVILNALRMCALDFDSADHTLVYDSGLVDCLETLLRAAPANTTPTITQYATSLFELLVGRLVIYEPSADAQSSEPTPLSKKLVRALESLLHVGPQKAISAREASSDASALKDMLLESGSSLPYATQFSCVATNAAQLPLSHSIVFWMKRKVSALLDGPFSYTGLVGKLAKIGTDEQGQMLVAVITDANSDTRKVKVKSIADGKEVEHTMPEDLSTPEAREAAPVVVLDTSIAGYLFSKGASGVISDADRRARVPTITSIDAQLIENGHVTVTYSFDEKDPVRVSSKFIPPETWVQVAITFDYNNVASIFVDTTLAEGQALTQMKYAKLKELESSHPLGGSAVIQETLAAEGSSTLVWFDATVTSMTGHNELRLTHGDWSMTASSLDQYPGIAGNEPVLRNGKIGFAFTGSEAAAQDWGFKAYYRGVSSKEVEEGRNVGSRLAWYIGQPPAYVETEADRALKGAMAVVHNLQVFGKRLSKAQLKALHDRDHAIAMAESISEPLLLRRLSVLRRAINNLDNLADSAMKRYFGTSGLVATLFDLMNHRSAIVKCSALQLARSILPQFERDYIDSNASARGMMTTSAAIFVENVMLQVGESLNTWAQRVKMFTAGGDDVIVPTKDGYQYLQSLTSIRLALVRSFVDQKGAWHELSKKTLRTLVTTALHALQELKAKVAGERESQAQLSLKQLCTTSEKELNLATPLFSLLALLGGVPNSISVGATVLYVDSDSGMSEEAIYLSPIEKAKDYLAPSNTRDEADKEYAAILLKRKDLKYTIVPKQAITCPNDLAVENEKLAKFLDECFDHEPLARLFEEVLGIATVDTRPKPSLKEEKVTVERVFESAHPYADNTEFHEEITIEGAESLEITFDPQSATEKDCDWISFFRAAHHRMGTDEALASFSGRNGNQNFAGCEGRPPLVVPGPTVYYTFFSDGSNNDWGYKFTVRAKDVKRQASTGILKPLPIFSTLVQVKMMGMKALTQIASSSNDMVRSMATKLNKVIAAAIQPTPSNTVLAVEKVDMKPLVFESTHPYADNLDVVTPVKVPGAKRLIITFDPETRTENNCDYLEFYTSPNREQRVPGSDKYTGGKDGGASNWPGMKDRPPLIIEGDSFAIFFHSDGSVNDWGYKMYVQPVAAKKKAKKIQVVRGAGFSAPVAEAAFMTLQGVVLDGLALPAESSFAQSSASEEVLPEYHDRSIVGLLQRRDELLSQQGDAFVVPTATVNKTFSVKPSFIVLPDEVPVYENHDVTSAVRSVIRKGQAVGVIEEWGVWMKLKEVRDQRNGPAPEPEIGWVQRRSSQGTMVLGTATTPFIQPMQLPSGGDDASAGAEKKKAVASREHPMYSVQEVTEEQQFFKKLIAVKMDERQLLQQDFGTIEEAMNDYATIAAGEYAKQLAELLMRHNDEGYYHTEDLVWNDLLSYLNISLSALRDETCVDKERAKRMAESVYALILSMQDKFGLEEFGFSAAKKLIDVAMDLVKTCTLSSSAKTSVSAPTQRGHKMTVESIHQYENNMNRDWIVSFPGAKRLELVFSEESSTETNCDYVTIYDSTRNAKLYEPKIHGYRSASNKHWPGVGGVPKLVLEAESCIVNFISDGSTVDWGFKVDVFAIYDEASAEEVQKYEAEQKAIKETSKRMLTMALWVAHRLAKTPVATLPMSIARYFYQEEHFRVLKRFSFLPVAAGHRDEMVDILSAFVTQMGPLMAQRPSLRQEFVELESSIVNTMRLAFFNETDGGTKVSQVSTSLQAMVQLVIALHQTMSLYLVDDVAAGTGASVMHPLVGSKTLAVEAAAAGATTATDEAAAAAASFDFGWKTLYYDHAKATPSTSSLVWEIHVQKLGFTLPTIGLVYRPSNNVLPTVNNSVGKNAGHCEVGFSGNMLYVNGTDAVTYPVPVKTWMVGDVIKVYANKEAGSISFSINNASMPCAVGPAAMTPLVEMNIQHVDFVLAISTLNVGDEFDVRVGASNVLASDSATSSSAASASGASASGASSSTGNMEFLSSVIDAENLFRSLEGKTLANHPLRSGLAPYCARKCKQQVALAEPPTEEAGTSTTTIETVEEISIPGATQLICGVTKYVCDETDEVLFHDEHGQFLARVKDGKWHTQPAKEADGEDHYDAVWPRHLVGCKDYSAGLGNCEFGTTKHTFEDGVARDVMILPVAADGAAPPATVCYSEFMPSSFYWDAADEVIIPQVNGAYFAWRQVTASDGNTYRFLTVERSTPSMYQSTDDSVKPKLPTTVKPHHLQGLRGQWPATNKAFALVEVPSPNDPHFVVVVVDHDSRQRTAAKWAKDMEAFAVRESVVERSVGEVWAKSNAVGFLKTTSSSSAGSGHGQGEAASASGGGGSLAKALKVGDKVVRGPAWTYGREDGGCGNAGTVRRLEVDHVIVEWSHGDTTFEGRYRYADGNFDVVLLPEAVAHPETASASSSSDGAKRTVTLINRQVVEVPGSFVRVTVRMRSRPSSSTASSSTAAAAAVAADGTDEKKPAADKPKRHIVCTAYPVFPRRVCLEDERFEGYRKQLESAFIPKSTSALQALAKYVDKTITAREISKDRLFRLKWDELAPSAEDLVRSALLKELVEQGAIEIHDDTRGQTTHKSKQDAQAAGDEAAHAGDELNAATLIAGDDAERMLNELATAAAAGQRRRRRGSRSGDDDDSSDSEGDGDEDDSDNGSEEYSSSDEDGDDVVVEDEQVYGDDHDEDDDDGAEEDGDEDDEDHADDEEHSVPLSGRNSGASTPRTRSRSRSRSRSVSRSGSRAASQSGSIDGTSDIGGQGLFDDIGDMLLSGSDTVEIPCERCHQAISERTYASGWTCDHGAHEGENHFRGGTMYGCPTYQQCNWWICPACWQTAQSTVRALRELNNAGALKRQSSRGSDSGAGGNAAGAGAGGGAQFAGHIQRVKPVETFFQMIQALNFHLIRAIPMIDLHREKPVPGSLTHTLSRHRALILSPIKNDLFALALDNTRGQGGMFELLLSRSRARKHAAMGKPDVNGNWTVFAQAFRVMHPMNPSTLRRNDRLYTTKLMGEHAQDAGGPYRESFDTYCQELQSTMLSLFVRTANGRGAVGMNREKWVLNPAATSRTELEMLAFVGKLMGIAIRSKEYLALNIPSIIWKLLAGDTPTIDDLEAVDVSIVNSLKKVVDAEGTDAENFAYVYCLTFTTMSSDLREVELLPGGGEKEVTYENRTDYRDRVIQYRLHEFDRQAAAVRAGLATIVPIDLLNLFTWEQLEEMVCGKAEIDVALLKSVTEYSSCDPNDQHVQFFWQVMDEFNNEERSALIRFAWGRSRLPLTAAGFSQRFKIQNLEKHPADAHLPEAHTCFFSLDLPRYSTLDITRERLRYVIFNCTAIDGDDTSTGMQVAAMGWEDA